MRCDYQNELYRFAPETLFSQYESPAPELLKDDIVLIKRKYGKQITECLLGEVERLESFKTGKSDQQIQVKYYVVQDDSSKVRESKRWVLNDEITFLGKFTQPYYDKKAETNLNALQGELCAKDHPLRELCKLMSPGHTNTKCDRSRKLYWAVFQKCIEYVVEVERQRNEYAAYFNKIGDKAKVRMKKFHPTELDTRLQKKITDQLSHFRIPDTGKYRFCRGGQFIERERPDVQFFKGLMANGDFLKLEIRNTKRELSERLDSAENTWADAMMFC